MPAAADQFQPSLQFQGARPGFVFTTGPHGTGYYKDNPPAGAAAAAAAAGQASGGVAGRGSSASGAGSQARPSAAAAAATAARRAAAAIAQQQQAAAKKVQLHLQVPSVKAAAPKPQLKDQGQEVSNRYSCMSQRCCAAVQCMCAASAKGW